MNDIPEKFNVNPFKILMDNFSENFERENEDNVIGSSELGSCARKVVLQKILKRYETTNMKMLRGKIFHATFQKKQLIVDLIKGLKKDWNFDTEHFRAKVEKEQRYHIGNDKYIEIHEDVGTSEFPIEFKFTSVHLKMWTEEIADKYLVQMNTYLGIERQPVGVLVIVNLRGFDNKFNSIEETGQKWSFVLPVYFDKELFNLTVSKAKKIFEAIDCADPDHIEHFPEHEWECGKCIVREECGKLEYSCEHRFENSKGIMVKCSKKMYEFEDRLTNKWLESPICQNCYENKIRARKPYLEIKYLQ